MRDIALTRLFGPLLLACVTAGCNSRDVVATAAPVTSCEPGCVCELREPYRYMFCAQLTSWEAADAVCIAHGMRLARIDSADENTWVRETATGHGLARLWFGATDQEEEGVWRWLDGDLVLNQGMDSGAPTYHAFPGEEPNRGTGANCGSMYESSSWHDQGCDSERGFVCRN